MCHIISRPLCLHMLLNSNDHLDQVSTDSQAVLKFHITFLSCSPGTKWRNPPDQSVIASYVPKKSPTIQYWGCSLAPNPHQVQVHLQHLLALQVHFSCNCPLIVFRSTNSRSSPLIPFISFDSIHVQ